MPLRLIDLDPHWLWKHKVFGFRCPCCRRRWLTCKRVHMSLDKQIDVFDAAVDAAVAAGEPPRIYTPCRELFSWSFNGFNFEVMTVTPSLDASESGHWHGHITNGLIVGGQQCQLAPGSI